MKRKNRIEEELREDTSLSVQVDPEADAQVDARVQTESADPATQSPLLKKKRGNLLGSLLSGSILSRSEVRRAYPYMIFVAALAFFYIANIFRTQSIYREHAQLTEQVKELRAKSMTVASERMIATRQSRIMQELERRRIPLEESLAPNKVIPRGEMKTEIGN